jgi:alpha-amylase
MGVMMQGFYWDCPRHENKEYQWWVYLRGQIPALAEAGYSMLWLPPVHKAASIEGPSMGYDPYDYYDLGEFDQKGSIPTWFGTTQELLDLIAAAHENKIIVLADMVINHNSGADAKERNSLTGEERWTLFQPKSGKFPRNWECFHPNRYETWDESTFGDMPDLSHRNPYVYTEILALARWLVEEIGFDGFRYDFVKGYGTHTITAIQEYHYERDGRWLAPYGVVEHWDSLENIEQWVNVANYANSNPVDAFDFPLREMLKRLCDTYAFNLMNLLTWESLLKKQPQTAVTFVENHDLREQGRPIVHDKLLAYSFILTHEGFPCVFWKDHQDLALPGTSNGINALVKAHEKYAAGYTQVLHAEHDLYIMQRNGYGRTPGLIYVLNNRGDRWHGKWVDTQWQNTPFEPVAWWSASDTNKPFHQTTDGGGRGQFYAPPRGYAVYAPRE